MPKSPIRILAYALLVALCAIAHPALAQVAPRMTIDSIPPGANVYIDGALQGQSGPNFKVRISKGQHKLVLELDGHKRFEQQINVSVAQKLTYPLEKAPARLDIKFPATNDGAKGGEVFVDGAPAGVVPVLVDLPPGRHLVEIRKPGQKAYTETVEIKAAETRPVWVTMQADQRGALHEVQVVGEQHHRARWQTRVQAAGGIGLHQGEHTGRGQGVHRPTHGRGIASLVSVLAAAQDQNGSAVDVADQQAARVAAHADGREGGQLPVADVLGDLDTLRQAAPTRAQQHGGGGQRPARALAQQGGGPSNGRVELKADHRRSFLLLYHPGGSARSWPAATAPASARPASHVRRPSARPARHHQTRAASAGTPRTA